MTEFKLTPEQERTLAMMKEQAAEDQHELEERLSRMTEEERQAYIEDQANMAAKMISSIPMKDKD